MQKKYKKSLKIALIILGAIFLIKFTLFILPFKELKEFRQSPCSLEIVDRDNNLLRILPLKNGFRREYTPLKEIPSLVKEIFITSEDKRFYFHFGTDPIAIIRSLYLNTKNKYSVSGASTITMQLSRIISPHSRGYKGKMLEIVNAVRIESKLSKKKILELWLNSIPFGLQAVGVESASKTYFGKSLDQLSPAQIIALAVIPRRPVKYAPKQKSKALINAAVNLAERIKYQITQEEIEEGIKNRVIYEWESSLPHFVNFVDGNIEDKERISGRQVKTSIDLELSIFIQERIKYYLEKFRDNRLFNGAALVVDNNTGEIIAYLGSQDFYDKEYSGEIDGVHVLNQPGSSIKPFLYALALDKGFLPSSILPDVPLDFGGENVYVPSNFNLRYNGPVRLRVALASSLNIPSVYIITRVGVKNFVEVLLDNGFYSLKDQRTVFGSGLALGNAEISLYELVKGFAVFPRRGKKLKLSWRKSNRPNEFVEGERVYTEYTSLMICDILSDNPSRALGFGTTSRLKTTFPAMFKTGTSDQFGNIWALGATPDYTVGIWLGNFSGNTVIGRTGSSLPAVIVTQILNALTKKTKDFDLPDAIQKVVICPLSGKLTTFDCPGAVYEYIPNGENILICDYHYKKDGKIKVKYPPIFIRWAKNHREENVFDSIDFKMKFPKILRPKDGAVFYFDPTIKSDEQVIKIEIIHKQQESISLYLNDQFVKSLSYPFTWSMPLRKGEYKVEVIGRDHSDKIKFKVK